jgi:cytochrome c-type biogenesis protein CcmH/NrfG
VIETLFALGQVQRQLSKLDDAAASYRRAAQLAIPVFGERSAVLGSIYAEQATLALARDLKAALVIIDRSTAIHEELEGKGPF